MKLTVTLPTHTYDIFIEKNSLQKIGDWVASLWAPQKIAVITDQTVAAFYGEAVSQKLKAAGFAPILYAICPGEKSKTLHTAQKLYAFLSGKGFTRADGILALGGGVVGDLAGFVASTYMRGIHFLQVPTTLLAQVDSSVGGKTGVNTESAKNLIGTFAQPDGVLIDPETLQTLEERHVIAGLAEVIKYAAIADAALWQQLAACEKLADFMAQAESFIAACCQIKIRFVEADERDTGQRLFLNFGHTLAHALENVTCYGVLMHGEAVAIGMYQITKASERLGYTSAGVADALAAMLQKFHLPIESQIGDHKALYQALSHDKKARGATLQLVLLTAIGQAKIQRIAMADMVYFLETEEGSGCDFSQRVNHTDRN